MEFVVTAATTPTIDLEFFFLEEDENGGIVNFVAVDGEVFACHSPACRPPTSGGTGGSNPGPTGGVSSGGEGVSGGIPKGAALSDETAETLFPALKEKAVSKGKVQHANGTLSVEGLNEDGSFKTFDDKTEAAIAKQYADLGVTHEQLTKNLVHTAEVAMGYDHATGQWDEGEMMQGRQIAAWYTTQGVRLKALSEEEGVEHDRVVAAATVLSAGRLWDGVANGNYETAARLIHILKDNQEIEVTQGDLDFQAWRVGKATKSTSRIGFDADLSVGKKVRPSDLDSAQLVELLYAKNAMRGYDNFADWARDSQNGMKTPRNHVIKGAPKPPYPLFTSKGTNQVQQAVAVLRGDVGVRQAISGPKYSSFFSNLRRPDLDYSSTNDTWHYRAMAGNLVLNPLVKKDKLGPGTIRELTVKDYAKYDTVSTAQDLFQVGASSAKNGLAGGDGMFRDSTRITRAALDTLKERHPEQFGDMKIHEMQALVWVYYGGGVSSDATRQSNWDRALETLPDD